MSRARIHTLRGSGLDRYAGTRPFSEETARAIDDEVHAIIEKSHAEARRYLETHRDALEKLVEALLARETLDEREIIEVTGLSPAPANHETETANTTEGQVTPQPAD